MTLQALLGLVACKADTAEGTEAQVVYECQPREDMSLYLAPIKGQAADAVMTLNAQAGKLLLEALSNQLQMCWLSIGKLTALLAINIKPSQEELRPQRHMSQTMPYSSTQHSVACVTEMLPLCCSAWHHS